MSKKQKTPARKEIYHDYQPTLLGECDYPTSLQIKAAMWAITHGSFLTKEMRYSRLADQYAMLDRVSASVDSSQAFESLSVYTGGANSWKPAARLEELRERGLVRRTSKHNVESLPYS